MIYAIVKKVVKPARISVVNLAPLISLGYSRQLRSWQSVSLWAYMTRSLEVEVPPHDRARYDVIQTGLVCREAHDC